MSIVAQMNLRHEIRSSSYLCFLLLSLFCFFSFMKTQGHNCMAWQYQSLCLLLKTCLHCSPVRRVIVSCRLWIGRPSDANQLTTTQKQIASKKTAITRLQRLARGRLPGSCTVLLSCCAIWSSRRLNWTFRCATKTTRKSLKRLCLLGIDWQQRTMRIAFASFMKMSKWLTFLASTSCSTNNQLQQHRTLVNKFWFPNLVIHPREEEEEVGEDYSHPFFN